MITLGRIHLVIFVVWFSVVAGFGVAIAMAGAERSAMAAERGHYLDQRHEMEGRQLYLRREVDGLAHGPRIARALARVRLDQVLQRPSVFARHDDVRNQEVFAR